MTARPGVDLAHALAGTLPDAGRALGGRSWTPGRDRQAVRHPAAAPDPARAAAAPQRPRVAVVGGGIAGVSSAVALAERGVAVTLLEAGDRLGGRVSSWPVDADGANATMSRGFHAFFRQYYTLRELLRRVDPDLSCLVPVPDYPLQHADGTRDSFTTIPRVPPFNMLGFVAQSPSFRLRDLPRVDIDQALGLLDIDFPRTFTDHDGRSARQVLDALRFPPAMRHLALEVFARSFFADPDEFSGGELVAMFHTYFLGSSEGLLFDVPRDDFDTLIWAPLGRYLAGLGADVRTGTAVTGIEDRDRLAVRLADGSAVIADAAVVATHRPGLQTIVESSHWLGDGEWRAAVAQGRTAPRFVVQRLWLDRPVAAGTAPFLGTAALGRLDNLSAVHLLEDGARRWAERTGGSVVELHAYAVPDDVADADVLADLRLQLLRLHPELDGARTVHEEVLVERDCPLVGTDPWRLRPGVRTPDPRVVLAGDGIRCELPVALMERAAVTGFQAANALLASWGRAGHDLWSVPARGRLGRGVRTLRRAAAFADGHPTTAGRHR